MQDAGYDPSSSMFVMANLDSVSVRTLTAQARLSTGHRELLGRHGWASSVAIDDIYRFASYRSNYHSRRFGELNLACCRASGLLFESHEFLETDANTFFSRLKKLTGGEVDIIYDSTEVGKGIYQNSFLINDKIYRYESPHSQSLCKAELAVISNSIFRRERISRRLAILAEPMASNLATQHVLFAEPDELDWLKETFSFVYVGNMPDY